LASSLGAYHNSPGFFSGIDIQQMTVERAALWDHVTGRGNDWHMIYRDYRDRPYFRGLPAELVGRFRVRLHTFALAYNHYYLIVELTEPHLGRAEQWLNVR
jgi:hypothetical protein